MTDAKPREPLVGYMIIEDYTDDYSDWSGQITYPDPRGANLAWLNPIKMIEHTAYDALRAQVEELRAELNTIRTTWQAEEISIAKGKAELMQSKLFPEARISSLEQERDRLKSESERLKAGVFYSRKYKLTNERPKVECKICLKHLGRKKP